MSLCGFDRLIDNAWYVMFPMALSKNGEVRKRIDCNDKCMSCDVRLMVTSLTITE